MSIFKDLVSIWNSEDLLSQAWDESREMMSFSEDMFSSAISACYHPDAMAHESVQKVVIIL